MKLSPVLYATLPLLTQSTPLNSKQQASTFLRTKRHLNLEKPWEHALDILLADPQIFPADKENLKSCTKNYHESYQEYYADHEEWFEHAGYVFGEAQPVVPIYDCKIGSYVVDLRALSEVED